MSDYTDSWKDACLRLQDELEAVQARLADHFKVTAPPELVQQLASAEVTVKWTYQ